MGREDARAFADIALLFELSLSVSQSLDLETNCERFLGRVMSRKNLAHAALWVRADALPTELLPSDQVSAAALTLVYHAPRRRRQPSVLPADHPALLRCAADGPYSAWLDSTAPSYLASESPTPAGMIAVFPLVDLGLLELGSLSRSEPLSARELGQLATVISGFAVSVKGCLDHLRMVSEMTAREELDEQLRHSQKMEAVGQLAGGVAHDFNNLLVGIVGSAELLRRDRISDPERLELASVILAASKRAADLTRQLLTFSRREPPVRRPVDVGAVVAEVVDLLERTIDRRVRIEVLPAENDTLVLGDGSELQNALLNLGLNARDAMPEGGRLTFRLRRAEAGETSVTQLSDPLPPGRYLVVEVADSGTGISESVRGRIFEPFFTTKEFGRGTGLGLAAVYGIVRSHGGAIAVESVPEQGTRFSLFLPATDESAEASQRARSGDAVVRGQGVVLVIDDEDLVGEMCCQMLESVGYEALYAPSGEEGLATYRREQSRIDLVLLDLMMPGMNGVETLSALRAVDPRVAVVMSSGFGHQMDVRQIRDLGIAGTLPKPFTLGSLSQTVAKVIGPRP